MRITTKLRWIVRVSQAVLVVGLLIWAHEGGAMSTDNSSTWTTTTVTTWARAVGELSPEWTTRAAAGEWAADFDLDGATDEFVATINVHLDGLTVTRSGDVYGPVGMSAADAGEAIRAVVGDPDLIDMGAILDRHPATTTRLVAWVTTSETMPGTDPGIGVQSTVVVDGLTTDYGDVEVSETQEQGWAVTESGDFDGAEADVLLSAMGYRRVEPWIESGGQFAAAVERE